jgi:hypothetical protein
MSVLHCASFLLIDIIDNLFGTVLQNLKVAVYLDYQSQKVVHKLYIK